MKFKSRRVGSNTSRRITVVPNNLILSSDGLIIGHRIVNKLDAKANGKRTQEQRPTYKDIILEFLRATSCHGMRFIGKPHISYFERFFFVAVIIIVAFTAGTFIFEVYQTWTRTPIVIQRSNTATEVTFFPFPALTICNKNQALKSKVKDIPTDSMEFGILQLMCNRYDEINFDKIKPGDGRNSYDLFRDTIVKVAQPCEKFILQCTYGDFDVNCSEIFRPTLTDEGLCCTFNALHPKYMIANYSDNDYDAQQFRQNNMTPVYWDIQHGFPKDMPKNATPRPILGAGIENGLTITLDIDLEEYYCSSTDGSGIKFNVHSPTETSLIKEIGFIAGTSHDLRVLLTPNYSIATKEVKDVPIKMRQCIYESESNLTFFKLYSMKNSHSECMSLKFSQACNCVPYYMPKIPVAAKYCDLAEMGCINEYLNNENYDSDEMECYNLLPGCFDLYFIPMIYRAEIYHATDNAIGFSRITNLTNKYVKDNIVLMNFFFDEDYYYSLLRRKFVDTTTYLSYTGGLVSLFMGVSSITLVEIFYFFCLKHFFDMYRYYKRAGRMQ